MNIFHGKYSPAPWHKTLNILQGASAYTLIACKPNECNTVHCMAGWTTFLTRGGLKLEMAIEELDFGDWDRLQKAEGTKLDLGDGVTACAAYLILHKAGWGRNIRLKDFFVDDATASRKIKRLAKLEAEREGG